MVEFLESIRPAKSAPSAATMEERAAAAGVQLKPIPKSLLAAVESEDPACSQPAKAQLRALQKSRQQTVARAEKRMKFV